MKCAVVTGGAGFIGRHLVERLLSEDWYVIVIDDLSTGSLDDLLKLVPEGDEPGQLSIYPYSITGALPTVKFDQLYHLAAPVSVPESIEKPNKYFQTIVEGSKQVFDWAKKMGCKHIVAASTAAVYGDPIYVPMSEDHPKRPLSPYAEYNLEMEEMMDELHLTNPDQSYIALRLFNVYGEGQRDTGGYVSAVPIFLKQYEAFEPITVTGNGTQTRDWIYVGDVVRAMMMANDRPRTERMQIYNVGTGEETRVIDLADALGGEMVHVEAREEPIRSAADCRRLMHDFDWKPETNLLEWIKEVK